MDNQDYHRFTRGFLPHIECTNGLIFITYRLNDSIPKDVLIELEGYLLQRRLAYEQKITPGNAPAPGARKIIETRLESDKRKFIEHYLDQGLGSCLLRKPDIANIIVDTWRHFDGDRYELISYTVMPTHVHLLIRQFSLGEASLSQIIHSWKSFTSHEIQKMVGHLPIYQTNFPDHHLWYHEYWDRMIRSERHLWNSIHYILNNPVKAKLCGNWQDWPYTWLTDKK